MFIRDGEHVTDSACEALQGALNCHTCSHTLNREAISHVEGVTDRGPHRALNTDVAARAPVTPPTESMPQLERPRREYAVALDQSSHERNEAYVRCRQPATTLSSW